MATLNIKAIAFAGVLAGMAGGAMADTPDLSVQQLDAFRVVSINVMEMPSASHPEHLIEMPSASDASFNEMPSASDSTNIHSALAALSDNPADLEKSVGAYVKKTLSDNAHQVNKAQQTAPEINPDFSPL